MFRGFGALAFAARMEPVGLFLDTLASLSDSPSFPSGREHSYPFSKGR